MNTSTPQARPTTLAEMVARYTTDDWTAEEFSEEDRSVTLLSTHGSSRVLNLDNYGVTLIIGGGYWGVGADLVAAKAKFRSMGGKLSNGYSVATFPPDTLFMGVDGMGTTYWDGEAPVITDKASKR